MTGFVVQQAGFNAGFMVLGLIALFALAVLYLAMPETMDTGAARVAATGRSPVP